MASLDNVRNYASCKREGDKGGTWNHDRTTGQMEDAEDKARIEGGSPTEEDAWTGGCKVKDVRSEITGRLEVMCLE